MVHDVLRVSAVALSVAAFVSLSPNLTVWADPSVTIAPASSPDSAAAANGAANAIDATAAPASGAASAPSGAAFAPEAAAPATSGTASVPSEAASALGATAAAASAPSGTASAPAATAAPASGTATAPSEAASASEVVSPPAGAAASAPNGTAAPLPPTRGAASAANGTVSRRDSTVSGASGETAPSSATATHHAHSPARQHDRRYARDTRHHETAYGHNVPAGVFGGVAKLWSVAAYPVYCFPNYDTCRVRWLY
jgi:hypothetical protein